ncbi:MAG TPA: thiol reductant ABC exporter subunit CydD [Rubrobacteraceae bacterium]|nr:thiol reductant ABC exporter subunit CydD [Rubrobacteraceae bacterium]
MNRALLRQVGSARASLILTMTLGVLAAVVTIAQMVFLSKVVARVFLKGADLEAVGALLLLLLGASVLRSGLLWAREVAAQRGAVRVKGELRERLFAHVLSLGPAFVREERTGELATAATEGVERLDAYFARYLPQAALSVLVPLLIAAYIFPRDWSSAVLLLVTAPVIPVMMVLVGSYAEEHTQRQWAALSRLGASFLDAVQGLGTLKALGRSAEERERVAAASEEFRRRTLKVLRYAFLSGFVLEFMTAMAIALVAVTLGVRLVSGSMPFEEAFVVLLLAPEFYRPLRELGAHRHAGMEGSAAADRIFEVLDTPAPLRGGAGARGSVTGGITVELSGVGYAYPGSARPAISDLTLTLPAGNRTALVGKSGSGKSTLVNLLLRFVDSDEGEIRANGVRIEELPVEAWRESVALVPQRPHLFYGSVLDNIRLARPEASREEVERAAELAGAAEFIRRLPEGYETQIGERGARLSGGEAQRVAIARAFLKDAPVLIMDEPTSSLDPESERLIRGALERLTRGRTVLVVAHRLNTVRGADRIAVLDDGRIAETGTHGELVRRGGLYAHLVNAYGGVPA